MHDFHYRNNELYCEETPVLDVARKYGTPLYIYSEHTAVDHLRKLQSAFKTLRPLICFSMKANSNLALCRALVKAGAGVDIVSMGELYKAQLCGAASNKIVFASVGKTAHEIEAAVKAGIRSFDVESIPELELIDQICRKMGRKQMVSIRLNPNVKADTHHFITTGTAQNKFGIDEASAYRIFAEADRYKGVELAGLHVHIGSQITEPKPFVAALKKALAFIDRVNARKTGIRWLNIGGGLGIIYRNEQPQTAQQFARAILPLLKGRKLNLILEPGRFIVGNSGILVTQVLYVKQTPVKQFAIVDAGMNDLIRPNLYGAYHEILPVAPRPGQTALSKRYDIVGPVCESGDCFAKNRPLSPVGPGDYLAIMSAGAYGFAMSSNYNARPRAAEVLVLGKKARLVRARETLKDLVRGEKIPAGMR